ncbi:hypothetical protein VULLAG_LOCUS12711 [Vulpes lagopus]
MAPVTRALRWGGGGRHMGGGGGHGGLSSSPPAPRSRERLETRGGSGSRSHSLIVPPGGDKEERQEQVTHAPLNHPPPMRSWGRKLAFGQMLLSLRGAGLGLSHLPGGTLGKAVQDASGHSPGLPRL